MSAIVDLSPDSDVRPLGPGSVSWRVHADPMMWVAGLRALYFQALHPRVIRGFMQNSDFRDGTWQRLMRTTNYVGTTTYGTLEEAHRAAARVRRIHDRLTAKDPDTGERYGVGDPDLLLWVHCCEIDSYLSVVRRSGLRLRPAEADRYVREQRFRAWLIGIDPKDAPTDVAALDRYFEAARPVAAVTPEARDAARFILLPPMNRLFEFTLARPGWASVGSLAYASLPRWARDLYRLPIPQTGLTTTAALRALRTAALAVPRPLREGPSIRAARHRISAATG
ncbi:MAG TPA: oxygenase MpaB family protein [Streptosporangiales bacterium]